MAAEGITISWGAVVGFLAVIALIGPGMVALGRAIGKLADHGRRLEAGEEHFKTLDAKVSQVNDTLTRLATRFDALMAQEGPEMVCPLSNQKACAMHRPGDEDG